MKKRYSFFALAVLCLFSISCSKEIINPEILSTSDEIDVVEELGVNGDFFVTFTGEIANGEETKTVFHNENGNAKQTIWWKDGDKVQFCQIYKKTSDAANYNIASLPHDQSGDAQTLVAECTGFTEPKVFPVYYVSVCPLDSRKSFSNIEEFTVSLPKEQKPTNESFDSLADILVSERVQASSPMTEFQLKYKRINAIARMTLKGLGSNSSVKEVVFKAKDGEHDVVLAGETKYNFKDGKKGDFSKSETAITLDYSSVKPLADNDGFTAFFTCYPFKLEENDTFTVTITTEDGNKFEREITLKNGQSLELAEGHGTKFTVNMGNVPSSYEASVIKGEVTEFCGTINDALSKTTNAASSATVKLLKSCKMGEKFDVANNVTLDLNGFTLTQNETKRLGVTTGGVLTISDQTGKGIITQSGTAHNTFSIKAGELKIQGGTISQPTNLTGSYFHINITESASLTVSGGKINSMYNSISFSSTGTLTITDGEITSTNSNAVNLTSGSATISGGKFKGNTADVYVKEGATMNISGGYFNHEVTDNLVEGSSCYKTEEHQDYPYSVRSNPSNDAALFCNGGEATPKSTIEDAIDAANGSGVGACKVILMKICQIGSASKDVTNSNGVTLDLNGKTLTQNDSYRLGVSGSGHLIITDSKNDGIVTQKVSGKNVFNVSSGTLDIQGGTIKQYDEGASYTIYLGGATLNVSGTAKIIGNRSYALNLAKGTVNITGGEIESSANHTIYADNSSDKLTVKITGGKIRATGSQKDAVYVKSMQTGSTFKIDGGSFYSNYALLYTTNSTINISGGYFYSAETSGTNTNKFMLCQKETDSGAQIIATGGYFGHNGETDGTSANRKFDPGVSLQSSDYSLYRGTYQNSDDNYSYCLRVGKTTN